MAGRRRLSPGASAISPCSSGPQLMCAEADVPVAVAPVEASAAPAAGDGLPVAALSVAAAGAVAGVVPHPVSAPTAARIRPTRTGPFLITPEHPSVLRRRLRALLSGPPPRTIVFSGGAGV